MKKLNIHQIKIIKKLYKSGYSLQELAKKFNVYDGAIRWHVSDKYKKYIKEANRKYSRGKLGYGIKIERHKKMELGLIPDTRKLHKKFSGRDVTREAIRKRDNYTCKKCGKRWIKGQRRFDIHHLNGLCGKKSQSYDYIEKHKELITYCHKCHLNLPENKEKMKKAKNNSIQPSVLLGSPHDKPNQ